MIPFLAGCVVGFCALPVVCALLSAFERALALRHERRGAA